MASDPRSRGVDLCKVEAIIGEEIRPLLRIHGGDVALVDATDGNLELEFKGACRACALKSVTYAIGIRERLRHVPGVSSVNVRGISLSAAALDRVAQAYASHPLLSCKSET
jgi:Fe-S cluster biogenesis protein NfuA